MSIQPHEYEDLVEKLFDDRLTEAELQRLNGVLRASPEARDHYWHLVMLEGYLADLPGWIAGQQYATQLAFSETLETFIEMESNADTELQAYPADLELIAEREPVTWQDVQVVGRFVIGSLVKQKAFWGTVAAAAICIAALVYATWFGGSPSQPPSLPIADQSNIGTDEPIEQAPVPVEPTPVAMVVNQFGLMGDDSIPNGTKLQEGHRIELGVGHAMQLEYESGVSVILQGPGTYELLSPERVAMPHGRISANVPPKGKGFTVSTAQIDFIDHGTEFIVALDESGYGEVVVLDGLIEARQTSPTADQGDELKSIMIREGVGGQLAPDVALPQSVQPIDLQQADRYARNWDDIVYRPRLTGAIQYVTEPPASLVVGETISADPMLIPERRAVVLEQALHLNSNKANRDVINKLGLDVDPQEDYLIDAGTKLNAFLIHYEIPLGENRGVVEREFEIQFSGRIVGIIQMYDYQLKTDELFGLESMTYPGENTLRGAADPPGHPNYDIIRVSDDLRTLQVKMRLSGMDQIRVLVENTGD
ncbi:MAG: hypothetical protein AAF085_11330 [Planctomycetota bacterium]